MKKILKIPCCRMQARADSNGLGRPVSWAEMMELRTFYVGRMREGPPGATTWKRFKQGTDPSCGAGIGQAAGVTARHVSQLQTENPVR